MKIFISYSIHDTVLVEDIANFIRRLADVYYWDVSKVPGQEAWPGIFNWIDQADIVLAVITDKTVSRAMSVGQEIGHAKAKNKMIIPLVGPFVQTKELGFLSGITYQSIDPNNPGPALKEIEKVILAELVKKQEQESAKKAALIIGGIFALLLLTGGEG